MKKLLIAVVLIFLLCIGSSYLFIPSQIKIEESTLVTVNPQAALRTLSNKNNWNKWWPEAGEVNQADSQFYFRNTSYNIYQQTYSGFQIEIIKNPDSIYSLLNLLPLNMDTAKIQWSGLMQTSLNPLKRIKQYWQAAQVKREMHSLLSSLALFLQKQENVYGLRIRKEIVKDTLLVFKESLTNVPPTPSSVYKIVASLKSHIQKESANETNFPMLNAYEVGQNKYRIMVAIPIDREIPLADSIFFKRMVSGWILVSDVRGGPATIRNAYSELNNFITDYSKTPVARPFESMVTNREVEKDTSKWITRIYFPIVL